MATLKGDVVEKGAKAGESLSDSGGGFSDLSTTILLKFIQVLEGALILVITWFLVRRLRKYFLKIETAHEQQKTALNMLEKITNGFVIVIGITMALKVVGLDMSLFVGVVLLGVSYGLKDIVKNYIAGILIFLKSPFQIGDIVKIKSYTGKIEHMELQSTTLKTFDNRDITIYNSDILSKPIENFSRYPQRRMDFTIEMAYGTNTEKAIKIFSKILDSEDGVLKKPKYRITFKKFSESGLVFELKFWVANPSDSLGIKSALAWKIHQSFDEKELITPFSKGFESESGLFAPTSEQAKRIEAFYKSPILQNLDAPTPAPAQQKPGTMQPGQPGQPAQPGQPGQPVQPAQPGQPGQVPQLAPEYADLDEPE